MAATGLSLCPQTGRGRAPQYWIAPDDSVAGDYSAPMRSLVLDYLDGVYRDISGDKSGSVADYIPELAIVDPDSFGICLATSDGYVYEAGDTRKRFAIQSVSKPFTYALALADRGLAAVAAKVDVEPSGEPFNEISLDPITERPRNPMINAGAITCASLIEGDSPDARFERLRSFYSRFAGRELELDEDMFRSEDRTGNRNRAIGYMLRSFGILDEDPQTTLSVYFRQCSIEVDCRDLSLMAATLADSGLNPVTNERVLEPGADRAGAVGDDHLRDVQRGRRLGDRGRAAGEKWCRRRHSGRAARSGRAWRCSPRGWTNTATASVGCRPAAGCPKTWNCISCMSAGPPGPRSGPPTTWWTRRPGAGAARRSRRCCCSTAAGPGCTSCTVTCCSPARSR